MFNRNCQCFCKHLSTWPLCQHCLVTYSPKCVQCTLKKNQKISFQLYSSLKKVVFSRKLVKTFQKFFKPFSSSQSGVYLESFQSSSMHTLHVVQCLCNPYLICKGQQINLFSLKDSTHMHMYLGSLCVPYTCIKVFCFLHIAKQILHHCSKGQFYLSFLCPCEQLCISSDSA